MVPTLAHSRSHARLSRNTALAQLCTPERMCTLTGEVKARPLASLFFPCAGPRRDVAPLLAALPWPSPWRFASCTRPQGRGAPSLWPFSARLATGFRPQLHASVPDCGSPVCRRIWHQPELHLGQEDSEPTGKGPSPRSFTRSASPVAYTFGPREERTSILSLVIVHAAPLWSASPRRFAAKSRPKSEPLTPLHPCAPKRTHVHVRSHRQGHLAAQPCSAVTPTLSVDAAVPSTLAKPHLSLGRGNPCCVPCSPCRWWWGPWTPSPPARPHSPAVPLGKIVEHP
jgi:hypothetical protein